MAEVQREAEARRPTQNVLEICRAALPSLRKSDAKVAHLVLKEPFWILDATVGEAAERAEVSQPTVIRFCVAIGFSGFQEFKMRLAYSLALGRPATHSVITGTDAIGDVAGKIFEYTLTSLDWARQNLDGAALTQAVELLERATSIEFFGYGASGVVAVDAQQKFPLFGVPCRAQSDAHQQIMTASMMRSSDVAVLISNTGHTRLLVEAAQVVRASGAKIIGIVGADSPVGACCDVVLLLETLDNTSVYTPTTSRIAALVVIDILSTAVALRRDESHNQRLTTMKRQLNGFRSGTSGSTVAGYPPHDDGVAKE